MSLGIPTGVGREVGRRIRHERYLRGNGPGNQVDEFVGRVALDVVFGGDHRQEVEHILVRDMALVGTGMHRDALSAETLAVGRHPNHIGDIPSARIAQSGHFVDVYTEFRHDFLFIISDCNLPVFCLTCGERAARGPRP